MTPEEQDYQDYLDYVDYVKTYQQRADSVPTPTPAAQPATMQPETSQSGDGVINWIGNAANSALFNKAPYLSAAIETPIEKAMGLVGLTENRPLSNIWQSNLEGGKQAAKQMTDNMGLAGNLTSSIAGGVINPTNKLKAVQAISQMSGPTGVAARAALNSAMNIASNDGSNIARDAKLGAGVSLGLDALGKSGQLLGKGFRSVFNRASGLTAQDYKAAAAAESLATAGQGKELLQGALKQAYSTKETSPIKKGIEYLRNIGVMAKPTDEFLIETAKRSRELRGPVDDKIKTIISEVSDSVGPGQLPDLDLIDAAAEGMNQSGKKKLYSKIDELWSDFYGKAKGTLKDIQKEKQGTVFSADMEMQDASQIWRRALRSRLEKATNEYGEKTGKWGVGELAKLNRQSGAFQALEKGSLKDLPGAQVENALDTMRKSLYTTGSSGWFGAETLFGIPGMIGAVVTHPNRVSRPLSKVLTDLSEGIAKGSFNASTRTSLNELNKAIGQDNAKIDKRQAERQIAMAQKNNPDRIAPMDYEQIIEMLKPSLRTQESSGNPDAVSPKGATGLYQIMPSTAKEIADELGVQEYDLKDPATNEMFYKHYMGKLLTQFGGDPKLALAAYNSGPGRVSRLLKSTGGKSFDDIKHLLPDETKKYVPQILSRLKTDLTAA